MHIYLLHVLFLLSLWNEGLTADLTGDYGDIGKIKPTGASQKTADQDDLTYKGVRASRKLALTDLCRVEKYKKIILKVAAQCKVDPAIIAGIMSRESRGGNGLDKNGFGDNGNGFGLMQVDKRSHVPKGGPYSEAHIKQATQILVDLIKAVQKKHPTWTKEQQLQGGIAAYNFGVDDVETVANTDVGTTNNDYSNDVIARAQAFRARGFK
ncbi:lysozyme g-like [Ciona intestinalis]